MDNLAEEVLEYWQNLGPAGWYAGTKEIDDEIRTKFLGLWNDIVHKKHRDWQYTARGSLALILVLDQFPRNMFRGEGESFATDGMALCVAQRAIVRDLDQEIEGILQQFFYLPFMHSESVVHQDTGVRSFLTRMPSGSNLLHARAHRQVIRQFGRFPYRNDALGRKSTSSEIAYLSAGGYGYTVNNLEN